MTPVRPQAFDSPPDGHARRRYMLAGAGAVAGLGGASLAWWRLQGREGSTAGIGAAEALWARTFETPAGGTLAMQSLRGRPLLVNFWATWCPPCIEELPLLDRFFRENAAKGFQVAGVAIDQVAAVRSFLTRLPLAFPVAVAGAGGLELVKSLGNLAGGLPFSVVLGSDGGVLHRKMGKVSEADLAQWALLK